MYRIREMTLADHAGVVALMAQTPGVVLRSADGYDATVRYLARNPGLSFVAEWPGEQGDALIGCIMSGHDGRRGYVQHLLVLSEYRRQGIGEALINACLDALEREGIVKSNIEVLSDNHAALRYWAQRGWQRRDDIVRFSYLRGDDANA